MSISHRLWKIHCRPELLFEHFYLSYSCLAPSVRMGWPNKFWRDLHLPETEALWSVWSLRLHDRISIHVVTKTSCARQMDGQLCFACTVGHSLTHHKNLLQLPDPAVFKHGSITCSCNIIALLVFIRLHTVHTVPAAFHFTKCTCVSFSLLTLLHAVIVFNFLRTWSGHFSYTNWLLQYFTCILRSISCLHFTCICHMNVGMTWCI